jgi:hypothetical protein
VLFIILLLFTGCGSKNTYFDADIIKKYKYGIIFSDRYTDAVIQLYDENGFYIDSKTYPARAMGINSSPGTPFINFGAKYYIASDSLSDPSFALSAILLDSGNLELSSIPTKIEGNYPYCMYISKNQKYLYTFFPESPDRPLYKTNIKSNKLEKNITFDNLLMQLGNISEFLPMGILEYHNTIILRPFYKQRKPRIRTHAD